MTDSSYSPHHLLPGVRAAALMGGTLAWFAIGLVGFIRHRVWGFPVLVSFLVVEAVFYAGTVAIGAFISQIENPSNLLKVIFSIGYVSGAVAAYYACWLFRDRLKPKLDPPADHLH